MKTSIEFEDPEDSALAVRGRSLATRQCSWVSIAANVALTVTQVAVGFLAKSQGPLADGVHSLSGRLCRPAGESP